LKTKDLRSIATMVGLGVALFAAGCGENAPCNTDPAQVEAARAELRAAEQQSESATAELAQAEQDKAKLENDMAALPDNGELEAELESLKKGSGR
jgi:multidrug resistance efflux pump